MTDFELKQAHRTLLRIVRERDDGVRFIPIVLRLESGLATLESQDAAYRRIMGENASCASAK